MKPRYSQTTVKGERRPREYALELLRQSREQANREYVVRAAGWWLSRWAGNQRAA